MNSTLAIIDIGTNTIILLVVKINEDGSFVPLHDEAQVVRLGQGINDNSRFLPEAMDRAFLALANFKATITHLNCQKIIAIGTAGFRNAQNSTEFINRVSKNLGFDIKVISGENEAELIHLATKRDFSFLSGTTVTVDIGGGSTEFIMEDGNKKSVQSLPFGSVKLTERFIFSDPPQTSELSCLNDFLKKELNQISQPSSPKQLIATAGTATTLAALSQKLTTYNPEKVHKSTLSVSSLETIVRELQNQPLHTRKLLPGMTPLRADVIVAGGHLLLAVARYFAVEEIWISDRGLRYGILYSLL